MIAFHLLKAEAIKLSEVVVQECARIWKDVLAYSAIAQEEVRRRWERYQNDAAAPVHTGTGEPGSCATDKCPGDGGAREHEHEMDEF